MTNIETFKKAFAYYQETAPVKIICYHDRTHTNLVPELREGQFICRCQDCGMIIYLYEHTTNDIVKKYNENL